LLETLSKNFLLFCFIVVLFYFLDIWIWYLRTTGRSFTLLKCWKPLTITTSNLKIMINSYRKAAIRIHELKCSTHNCLNICEFSGKTRTVFDEVKLRNLTRGNCESAETTINHRWWLSNSRTTWRTIEWLLRKNEYD